MRSLQIWPHREWRREELVALEGDDVLVTGAYLPVHVPSRRLLLDQSYSQVALPPHLKVHRERFLLEADAKRWLGRYLLIGGPFDTVWYHWLFNWAPRLLLAERLRPELVQDKLLRILVHPLALQPPFSDVLACFDFPLDRYVPFDAGGAHLLSRAVLVSFPDQARLYPDLIHAMRERLLGRWQVRRREGAPRRIFASRQALPWGKRRIVNYEEFEGPLAAAGFTAVSLGEHGAAAQADLFLNADIVLGGHGSDLANLLFCRPGTRVYVLEHAFNLRWRLHCGLEYLCEVLGLEYRALRTPTRANPQGLAATTAIQFNEDFVVDPAAIFRAIDGGELWLAPPL